MRVALVLVSLAASLALAQDINTVPACGQTCFNSMKGTLGCAAGDQKCLCDKADYHNGLKDCVNQSCAADAGPATTALTTYVDAVCAAAAAAPAASSSAPSAAATSPPPPPPTSTPVPSTTPTTPSTSPTSSTTGPATTSTSASTSTSSTSTSSTPTKSTSSTSSSATASGSPAAATSDQSAVGLSNTAKVGIIVGCVAAALGLLGVLVCVFLHKRRQKRDQDQLHRLKISDPMPGAGRSFAGDHFNDKYQAGSPSNADFKSRRYEDMLPRQMPRNMV